MARASRQTRNKQAGFTLIEVIAVLSLLVVIFLTTWNTFREATAEVQVSIWETDLDADLRKSIFRISGELKDSGSDTDGTDYVISHPRAEFTELPSVMFQKRLALSGVPADDWSSEITYQLADAPGEDGNNGIDDDGDGIVDERTLVRIQDDVETVIANGVSSFVITRNAGDDFLTIQVTIARPNINDLPHLSRTLATTVALRNRDQM